MTDKPLNCVGIDPAQQQTGSHDFRPHATEPVIHSGPLASSVPAATPKQPSTGTFQERVRPWMQACFGEAISGDRVERNHRFLEEALELVQACGCSREESLQLVDYVYGRPVGEPQQEVGGVQVTLAALCLANNLDMHESGEVELARIWGKIEQIRAKQAAKPRNSPLPQATTAALKQKLVERVTCEIEKLGVSEVDARDFAQVAMAAMPNVQSVQAIELTREEKAEAVEVMKRGWHKEYANAQPGKFKPDKAWSSAISALLNRFELRRKQ